VSFNFDTNLNERQPGPKFDYRLPFDWRDENRVSYASREGIPLIKLNGSLDWAVCSNDHLGLLHYFVRENTFSGRRCRAPNCGSEIDPLIIMPHASHASVFARLWQEAGQLIEKAERIVIIGYSFPHYDTRVIQLFQERVRKDTDIEIIDVKTSGELEEEARFRIRANCRQIFPGVPSDQLTIWTQGLVEYLQKSSA
jgi:NAD-dependent SIR2 family protein deacetylase